MKKIFLDFSEIGKPLKKIEFRARKIGSCKREISILERDFTIFWRDYLVIEVEAT